MTITTTEYKKIFDEDDAVGWDCISQALETIYPNQAERHYGTIIKYQLGGPDPLDGISIYDQSSPTYHRHIVSYGMSELYYNPEQAGSEYSGWGFEFTFRIAPFAEDKDYNDSTNEPMWAIALMQNLARYVFESGNYFDEYHFIPCNETIRSDTDTKIVGVAFVLDPQLDIIDTPHGKVKFLQMVGVTQAELDWLWEDTQQNRPKQLLDKMREDNPLLITDLTRSYDYV